MTPTTMTSQEKRAGNETFLEELTTILGPEAVLTDSHDLAAFEKGWRYGEGRALAAVRPSTPEQVALVLAACDAHGIRVQPIGANTGLVGASNPDATGDMLVLSLERLRKTLQIDATDRTVLVDGGVLLSELNAALAEHGLWLPIDLGADPQVGGMVATNTGGTRLVRYGDVRRHLLGLEVALSNGRVQSDLRRLRKNNTGLDWKQLFVGTSGTFGIVTRAVFSVEPLPRQTTAALAAVDTGEGVLALLGALERTTGNMLSAYEVLSHEALEVTLRHGANVRPPFAETPRYTVLIELSSTLESKSLDLSEILQNALEACMESDAGADLLDVVVGRDEDFWSIRHQVSESLRHEGRVLALDLAVPRSQLAHFTDTVREELTRSHPFVRMCDFGHWGDGGTHLNLVWSPEDSPEDPNALRQALQTRIYDLCVRDFGGSYSAEHGVGPHNQDHYERFTPRGVRDLAGVLKQHLDPERRLGTVRLD